MRPGLARTQCAFAAALFDTNPAVPSAVRNASTARATSGFAVYRNNVASSLITVLMARFPVVVRLIGDEAFQGLALRFLALCPPGSPVMLCYGEGFADFLDGLSETAMARYLADVARLELARGRAYHAADSEPLAPARFAALSPAKLAAAQVLLHPSLTLLRSRFPVVSVWEVNQPDADQVIRCWKAEDAAVLRPRDEVQVLRLADGGFAFLSSLAQGSSLAAAINAGVRDNEAFDLTANLAMLAGSGVAVELR